METLAFYLFGALAVTASALAVCLDRPMYSVLLVVAAFIGLAGLYVLLDSPFAAVIQIIIYAGAIMVLMLFTVMLLNAPREEGQPATQRSFSTAGARWTGAALALVLLGEFAWALARIGAQPWPQDGRSAETLASVRAIGRVLFTDYGFAFEVTSILILVAIVGAVALAKREP